MNYELALKLKEAGWDKETFWFYTSDETDTIFKTAHNYGYDTANIQFIKGKNGKSICSQKLVLCYAPTLSELIKACGNSFLGLSRTREAITSEKTLHWRADGSYSGSNLGFTIAIMESTPEEAVANLWLKLNKKD